MQSTPEVTVIIPVYNEAPNLPEVLPQIKAVLEEFGRTYEIIAVDDGSSDNSVEILRDFQKLNYPLRVLRLARNFGQTMALYAGFSVAKGAVVVNIDADLQNPPGEMIKMIHKLEEGYDVVQGWRENRQDPWYRRLISRVLNKVVSALIGIRMHDLGCGLKVFSREIVDRLTAIRHQARYLPAEYMWMGAKIAEVKVAHRARERGTSKYNMVKLLRLNFNLITSISNVPIRVVEGSGWFFLFLGSFMGVWTLGGRLFSGQFDFLRTIAALAFFLAGVQLLATMVVAEYAGRIYTEVQGKPVYIIKEIIE